MFTCFEKYSCKGGPTVNDLKRQIWVKCNLSIAENFIQNRQNRVSTVGKPLSTILDLEIYHIGWKFFVFNYNWYVKSDCSCCTVGCAVALNTTDLLFKFSQNFDNNPSRIRCRDLNSWLLNRESPLITCANDHIRLATGFHESSVANVLNALRS